MKKDTEDLTYMHPTPMSKTQLARLYAPRLKEGSALNRLAHWMHRATGLLEELEQTGYRPTQRLLTARHVAIIFRYLGPP